MDTRKLFRLRVKQFGGFSAAAKSLGCSQSFVYLLASGTGGKLPSLQLARQIEDLMGVPMRAWTAAATTTVAA